MNYDGFLEWMFGLERFGIKLGLENISEFMSRIGDPQTSFKSVHVTGTNGKGSVCVLLSEILMHKGLRVGLYTSPHLVDFRERVKINGEDMPRDAVLRIGEELKRVMEQMRSEDHEKQLTFFEFTTGLAFKYFEEQKVDIVVAEVGMGGRLDATNVIEPEVAAITRIGLEHTNYLGKTIPDIAREKAGIIKKGASVVTCERKTDALHVIETVCAKKGAVLRRLGRDFDFSEVHQSLDGTSFDFHGESAIERVQMRLLGSYQAENGACATAIIEELNRKGFGVSEDDLRAGMLSARWPGRLDIISRDPFIMFDGSHNPDGVTTTAKVITELGLAPLTYVLGCMDDKDAEGIVRAIVPTASEIITTQARYKRALPAAKLGDIVKTEFKGPQSVVQDAREAFEIATEEGQGNRVCVIGSLYLVGEAMTWWESTRSRFPRAHKV